MEKFLVDTNIFIYNFNEDPIAKDFLITNIRLGNTILYSFVTRLELLLYYDLTHREAQQIDFLLQQFNRVEYNARIEEIILSIGTNKKVKIPDAIIAASAIYSNSILVTRNTKDFINIPNLNMLNPFEEMTT